MSALTMMVSALSLVSSGIKKKNLSTEFDVYTNNYFSNIFDVCTNNYDLSTVFGVYTVSYHLSIVFDVYSDDLSTVFDVCTDK